MNGWQWDQGRIKNYLETNKNENTTAPHLWDAVKAVLRRKFIALQAYLKKQEKPQIKNLTLHLKELQKNNNKAQSKHLPSWAALIMIYNLLNGRRTLQPKISYNKYIYMAFTSYNWSFVFKASYNSSNIKLDSLVNNFNKSYL